MNHQGIVRKNTMGWHTIAVRFLTHERMSYAWIAGGALWIVWILSILFGSGNMDLASQVVGTDYIQFYTAGMTLRNGDSDQLYDFAYQQQLQQEIAGPEFDTFHAFITPPFLALIYVPLSFIPYSLSFGIWSILCLIALWLSLRLLGFSRPKTEFLWTLSWFPVFATISFGQNSILSLILLTLSYVLWKRDKKLTAGLICSLLLYKPQLLLGVGILWALEWRRSWRALLGLCTGAMALILLNFWLFPVASEDYLNLSISIFPSLSSREGFPIWHSQTLRSFWHLLLPKVSDLPEILALVLSLIGLFFFFKFRQKFQHDKPLLFAAAVSLTLWISPHALVYEWTLLLLPAIILWEAQVIRREKLRVLYALIWVAIFISGPLTNLQLNLFSRAVQVSTIIYSFVLTSTFISMLNSPRELPQSD